MCRRAANGPSTHPRGGRGRSTTQVHGAGAGYDVLGAVFTTDGVWNVARFHDRQYDALFKQHVAAVDLQRQRADRWQDRSPKRL